jgi:hypothetical protein
MNILAIDREGICVDDGFFNSTVIYLLASRTPRLNHYYQSLVPPSTGESITPREISLILLPSSTMHIEFHLYLCRPPRLHSPQTTLPTSPPPPHIKSIPTQIQGSQQLGTGLSHLAFPTSRHSRRRKYSASQNVG